MSRGMMTSPTVSRGGKREESRRRRRRRRGERMGIMIHLFPLTLTHLPRWSFFTWLSLSFLPTPSLLLPSPSHLASISPSSHEKDKRRTGLSGRTKCVRLDSICGAEAEGKKERMEEWRKEETKFLPNCGRTLDGTKLH